MHVVARLIVAAIAVACVAACEDPSRRIEPVRRPGVDGLVAFLQANRRYELVHGDCVPEWRRDRDVMTPGYGDLIALGPGSDVGAFVWLWDDRRRPDDRAIQARVLYANDPDVPAELRRTRQAFPVGAQPMVATVDGRWLPAVWLFTDQWLCFVSFDRHIADRIHDDACRTAYVSSGAGRCLDFAGGLAGAVVANDEVARDRLCGLIVAHGCGSVPAEAPPLSQP